MFSLCWSYVTGRQRVADIHHCLVLFYSDLSVNIRLGILLDDLIVVPNSLKPG